ncbi:CmcJ/NvfI family oxidoreductase [Curvivirga sp.]|uniref:CmcJ/NvfI family oxidoreductase n=1 Tax=Curvivirga sp. TaxID=2856848 RepID=UPI003B5C4C8C
MKTAKVNYHVTSHEPQAFHIDANGVKGNLVSPILEAHEIELEDIRKSNFDLKFSADSITFVNFPTKIKDFGDKTDWKELYNQEINNLLVEELNAKDVIVFDHTIRLDDPDALRKPARNVHGDYSVKGAHHRLHDILGSDKSIEWEKGHFGFVNIWRPLHAPVNSSPLGFIHPKSVKSDDWVNIGLIYPDRKGHILGLVQNADHQWIYMSKMTPDEVAIFNVYDNQGLAPIGHSALDGIEDVSQPNIRMSLESRALVRYS